MKAVFFDKDGTLVKNVPYNVNPNLIELLPGATQAVQNLREAGFRIFIVSNQSGVARGFFIEKDLTTVWQKINELCQIEFDGFYFCPHLATGKIEKYSFACDCRKPEPGLILRAAHEHQIDLANSWIIGDALSDVAAGQRAGCQTILLGEYGAPDNKQDVSLTAKNLTEATKLILRLPERLNW